MNRLGLFAATATIVLFAAWASADEPWNDTTLSVPKLTEARTAAQAALREADDKEDAEGWRTATKARIGDLEHLINDVGLREVLEDQAANEQLRAQARAALTTLRSQSADEVPLTATTKEDLRPFEEAKATADKAREAAKAALARAEKERSALTSAGADGLRKRADEAKARREALEKGEATPLRDYRIANEKLVERLVQIETELLELPESKWSARIEALHAQHELAEARATRAQALFTRASAAVADALAQASAAAAKQAKEDAAAAAREKDPIARFEAEIAAEVAGIAAAETQDQRLLVEAKERLEASGTAIDRLETNQQGLEKRLNLRGGTSGKIAELLRSTLTRLRKRRDVIRQSQLPWTYRQLERVQTARAEVQDRRLEADLPADENPILQRLLKSLGKEGKDRAPEARAAFDRSIAGDGGLLHALRTRVSKLETLELRLAELESGERGYGAQVSVIDNSLSYVMARIYWIRTHPPVSGATFRRAFDEAGETATYYTRPGRWSGVGETIKERPWMLLGLLVALVLGAGLVGASRRKTPAFLTRWLAKGGSVLGGVKHTLATLVRAALAPALLLLIAFIVRVIDPLTEDLAPLARGIELFAITWFAWRFVRRFLGPQGVAVKRFGMAEDLALQLCSSARFAAWGVLLFLLPREVLRSPPLYLEALPRLFYAGFLVLSAVALWKLLPRKAPLAKLWVGNTGFWHGMWGLLTPLLGLVLLGIVAMDVLGYRIGSHALASNLLQTMLAALVLSGLYFLLRRTVQAIAVRVLETEAQAAGAKQARKTSAAVLNQMTRLVSVTVLVLAVVLMARFWEIDAALKSALSQFQLVEVAPGDYLTLWNVFVALLVVVIAHFFVRNLGGLLEFVVFPLLGTTDAGSRYVLATLARYAILVAAWSVAFVILRFSFSSIGWLLAAASVGLGFGLQEIVANFVSGLILLIERPVRVGDTISVGDTWGTIERINARATLVTNRDRQTVIVPNKNFITEEVTNWTRNDRIMRRELSVGVAYGSDIAKVLGILEEAVEKQKGVLKQPAPRILFTAFGNSSLDFAIWFYADVDQGVEIRSDLHKFIDRRFREEGVEIPFPQRDLHIRSGLPGGGDGEEPKDG